MLPSATEIVCALGAGSDLVGVSHECDFPDDVRRLPALTRARLRPANTSREIDQAVRSVLQDALAVYEIELERLEAARPDVIVTQDLCDVCAVSFSDVCAATATLVHQPVTIVNLHPNRLDDIWGDIARVADALGRGAEGADLVRRLRARVAAVAQRCAASTDRPRVLAIEWLDPVMVGGMWMPELIELVGGDPLVTRSGDHARTLSMEALAALQPDVVLIKPCGFSLARTLEELDVVRRMLPWHSWPALGEGRVFVADGNAYFNRPGPRIVESLENLAACVRPRLFDDVRDEHRSSAARLDAAWQPHEI